MGIFATPRYQELVIHDLRTPLNVISLALRMIDDLAAVKNTDIAEDIDLIKANANELERMLTHLVEFSRLPESPAQLAIDRFSPTRLIDDVVEEYRHRPRSGPVDLDTTEAPGEVELDPVRARVAFQKSLHNAAAASQGKPVHVRMGGAPDRLVVEFAVDVPPRDSVQTHTLSASDFERVIGTPAERRGLELTIAARISELFGGTARLEAIPGRGTVVTLDWPARVARPA